MKVTKAPASVTAAAKGKGLLLGVAGVIYAFSAWGNIDDPVAYWSFDDAGHVLANDVTSDAYHDATVLFGTPVSGVEDGATGIEGNALVLDGATGIRLPYHQDNLGTSFTLAFWYWQLTNDTRQCVYQTRDNYTATYEAMAGYNTNFATYAGESYAGSIITAPREWIHLVHAFSTTGSTVTLSVYTNGAFVFSKAVSSNSMFDAKQVRGFHFGAYRTATGPADGRCFKGMFDELAFWNRTLSAEEVLALYQRGASGQKLTVTPVASPVISLAGRERSFTFLADDGIPDGMFDNGWLLNGIQDPAYPYTAVDTAGDADAALGRVPDTAGNASGPFDAQVASVKWQVPLTEAMRQLSESDYTLETWIRTTYWDRGTLMGNHSTAAPDGVINLETYGTNNVRLYQRNAAGTVIDFNLLATNVNTRDGKWHHVAGVRQADTMSLYVDGVKIGSTETVVGTYTLAGNYWYLGRDERTTVAFNGEQGDTRIWTRALSADELTNIVALKLPGGSEIPKNGLLAEYALYNSFDASKPYVGFSGYQIGLTPPQLRQLPMTNFTCEAVFRTTSQNFAVLMGNWSNYVFNTVNLQLESPNSVRLYMQNAAGTKASLSVVPPGVNTRDGQWHRLAAVRNNNTVSLYVDGTQVGSTSETLGPYLLTGDYYYLFRDGRDPWSTTLNGDLAQARIWTRALSASELANLAASGTVPTNGLIAQYAPMLTNNLHTAGFPGNRFLRSFSTATNTASLVFTDLPRHNKVGLGMLLAQLDSLDPVANNDHFEIRVDGTEVLSVGLGPNQGSEPQVSTFALFGAAADAQLLKNTLTAGGGDLFFCGTAWGDYHDHVYDLSELEALQAIPHTGSTLTLEFLGVQNGGGENESFGMDQIELTVYPLRGTLLRIQ